MICVRALADLARRPEHGVVVQTYSRPGRCCVSRCDIAQPEFESKNRGAVSRRSASELVQTCMLGLNGNFMSDTSMSSTTVQVFASDKERWSAVLRREAAADGHFYYSVKTTGVYCRPTCSARRPSRENVSFHATSADAQQAGFRSCLRCRPEEPPLRQRQTAAVLQACRVIETADEFPSLETLATSAGMSRFHFHRVFKAVVGVTPRAYAAEHRASRVRNELIRADSVTEAVYGAGFSSSGRFYASSSSILGMQPARFRSGGSGVEIRFAVGECSLGSVLVAATAKGVCAILLGDDPEVLVQDLEDRFPKAQLTGDDSSFENLVATVVGFVEAPAPRRDRIAETCSTVGPRHLGVQRPKERLDRDPRIRLRASNRRSRARLSVFGLSSSTSGHGPISDSFAARPISERVVDVTGHESRAGRPRPKTASLGSRAMRRSVRR
jgi:AraC family transcriptional regulator, regulatory protein of adaptative response / methylated-DNA-[protein]-cysteine methyltransferase